MPGVKIVSVMTTDSSGGAEFAAVEMLEALRQRGHETVMLTDMPAIGARHRGRGPAVALGPKLSTGSWVGPDAALAVAARGACAPRCSAQAPYDVLMVHYKKEQLLAAHAAGAAAQHGRVGGVGTRAVPAAQAACRGAPTCAPASASRW